jgi:hypothetical protein
MLKAFLKLVKEIINHLKINFSVCIEDMILARITTSKREVTHNLKSVNKFLRLNISMRFLICRNIPTPFVMQWKAVRVARI